MKTLCCLKYSRELLKGRRMRSFAYSAGVVGILLFFRLAEATGASIMLYCTGLNPNELFSSRNTAWQVFVLACTSLKYISSAPVIMAAAGWFTKLCGVESGFEAKSFSDILSDSRLLVRSIAVTLVARIMLMFFFVPSGFFLGFAYEFIVSGGSRGVFYGVHCISMAVFSALMWLWAVSGALAVPFIWVRDTQQSVFSAIRRSFSVMKGRRIGLAKVAFMRCLPFILAEFFTAISLYINICIKEAEYNEWVDVQGKNGQADNPAKLPHRSGRRFKAAADEAETTG